MVEEGVVQKEGGGEEGVVKEEKEKVCVLGGKMEDIYV